MLLDMERTPADGHWEGYGKICDFQLMDAPTKWWRLGGSGKKQTKGEESAGVTAVLVKTEIR
jgi:hypothetical protein